MGKSQEAEIVEARRLLDRFLVENEELETLESRLRSFNLFNVLRIGRAELRHSNVLGWLLTPYESHGLGDRILRRFLSRLLLSNDSPSADLSPAKVELMNFGDIEVFREHENVDILASSRSNKWVLLIENKILSKESPTQLVRYVERARRNSPGSTVVPVFLTLPGDEPSQDGLDAGFLTLSHVEVLELIERLVVQNETNLSEPVKLFLHQYLETLRRLTMQDDKLVELCKTIYRRHKAAIDLIVEYGSSSQVMEVVEQHLSETMDLAVVKARGRLWFLPKAMRAKLPEVDMSHWQFLPEKVPIVWWFKYIQQKRRIGFVLEVGPLVNSELRKRLLRKIKDAGFEFSEKSAFKEGAKFTRVLSRYQSLRKSDDDSCDEDLDYIKSVVDGLWKKVWSEGQNIMPVLSSFDWKESA